MKTQARKREREKEREGGFLSVSRCSPPPAEETSNKNEGNVGGNVNGKLKKVSGSEQR